MLRQLSAGLPTASQFVSLFCQETSVVFPVIKSPGDLLSTNDRQESTIPQIPVGVHARAVPPRVGLREIGG